MRPDSADPSLIEDDYLVSVHDRRDAVRDCNDGTLTGGTKNELAHPLLADSIQLRGDLVKE